jgi:uncharacterized protein (TIGR04255 family)
LPEYDSPPVTETSVGIQFDGLSGYNSLAAADFWSEVRDDFPLVEERQPLEPAFETFGPSDGATDVPRIEMITDVIQPRFFFVSKDETQLIQLQRDRLFYNWRRTDAVETYPRYTHVRSRLSDNLDRLYRWSDRLKLGDVVPTQCEAVYVNRIPVADAEGNKCGLSFIFPWLDGLQGMTEDGMFRFRRRLNDDSGQPVARLNCNLRYGTDDDGAREAHLMLAVRGRPSGPLDRDACLEFIDAEREVIVRTFTEVTSPDAHKLWERTR